MTAPVSGRYYIVIYGNGMPDLFSYFFKAIKAEQTKTVTIPSGLTFSLICAKGNYTSPYQTFDTRGIMPSDAILNSVSIDSNGSGTWRSLTRYLRASNGYVYSSYPALEYVNYVATDKQKAAQVWQIAGLVSEPSAFSWKPNITMTYTYREQP